MKIAIFGGTGLIGRRLASRLQVLGHEVVAAARSAGADTISGRGIAEAISDADVAVDVSNSSYGDVDGMRRYSALSTARSEEHTSELQSLMRISYAVFCLKKKKKITQIIKTRLYNNKI